MVIAEGQWGEADAIKARVKAMLKQSFGIDHSTLEFECARHACDAPSDFGGPGQGAADHA